MKKTLIILFLLFSSLVVAEDISDLEIEGISVGDSLLDYMTESEIIKEIETNKYMYDYLEDDTFGEVYSFDEYEIYDQLSFFVKPNDKKFIIHSITGTMPHEKNIHICYKKMDEIAKEFTNTYKNAKKNTYNFNHAIDASGDSKVRSIVFLFDNGDLISIMCLDFEEKLRIKNNWIDGLDIIIRTKEVEKWLSVY